jgi:hypothetical protein
MRIGRAKRAEQKYSTDGESWAHCDRLGILAWKGDVEVRLLVR